MFHTGVPIGTRGYSHVICALVRRAQPWLKARGNLRMSHGSLVPWMPMAP